MQAPFVAPMRPCGPQPTGRNHPSGGVSMTRLFKTAGCCHARVVRRHERSWSNLAFIHNDKHNKLVPRRTNALASIFSGRNFMCTCAKMVSQGCQKDPIPWRWREDEEDQQVEEEDGEELPDQEKQPVLEEKCSGSSQGSSRCGSD
mmetsp:Transcript_29333/g.86766  ORF Transcript_29333/g.86766 Transcript_29333/m.86766 type:complete len:146 (+) Transcript_29333:667-1104(+)